MKTHDVLGPGDVFAGYTVERLLGRGGMGAVYLAQSGGERRALKILSPPDGEDRHEWRRRFAREAELAMKIRHRNLVAVHSADEDPETGLGYIVMDYVPGGTLSERIAGSGRFGMRAAVDVVVQIAAALEVAHRAGVVHRDIKPDNIMFDADGTPKLADLGVAKISREGVKTTTLTSAGAMIGTPAYMSPEQMMDAHAVDSRADIYSLGLVLYEMLAGTRPHPDSTVVELLARAVNGEEMPDIRTVRPEVSAALAYVISLMLSTNPEDRPQSARTAARLLENACAGKVKVPEDFVRIRGRARARRKAVRVAAVALGSIALALAVVLVVWIGARRGLQPIPRGIDSLTAGDVSHMVGQSMPRLYSAVDKRGIAGRTPGRRIVVKVLPIQMPNLPTDTRTKEIASELEMQFRREMTDGGRFIFLDGSGEDASGARVQPDCILKGRLTCLATDNGGSSDTEFRLNLALVDVRSGLEVWQGSVVLVKRQ